jgi:hypothetical protein
MSELQSLPQLELLLEQVLLLRLELLPEHYR